MPLQPAVLSIAHQAPLEVLRKAPAIVATLLREALGVEVPDFGSASVIDADFTQARATPFHADLAITLHGAARDRRPVMGIIVEIQRHRDNNKRYSWPLYVAALHARLGGCQTCLIVLASDERVARWAAAPIRTLQPGSPFIPLVIGPEQIPQISVERARREPWLAALFALAHGDRHDPEAAVQAAVVALEELPEHRAMFFDLISASFNETAWRALENAMRISMRIGDYELRSTFARRYFGKGLKKGIHEGELRATRALLVELAKDRFGLAEDDVRRAVEACDDVDRLTALFSRISVARDRRTVERLLAKLDGAGAGRSVDHPRPRRRTITARRTTAARTARRSAAARRTTAARTARKVPR